MRVLSRIRPRSGWAGLADQSQYQLTPRAPTRRALSSRRSSGELQGPEVRDVTTDLLLRRIPRPAPAIDRDRRGPGVDGRGRSTRSIRHGFRCRRLRIQRVLRSSGVANADQAAPRCPSLRRGQGGLVHLDARGATTGVGPLTVFTQDEAPSVTARSTSRASPGPSGRRQRGVAPVSRDERPPSRAAQAPRRPSEGSACCLIAILFIYVVLASVRELHPPADDPLGLPFAGFGALHASRVQEGSVGHRLRRRDPPGGAARKTGS
jgi:hypothetical protein